MSIPTDPEYQITDYSKFSNVTKLSTNSPELELVEHDTVLGLGKYQIFQNTTPMCTWLRNGKIGEIIVYPTSRYRMFSDCEHSE